MLSRDLMHDYQNRAVRFIKDVPKCALWLDMGLGKTLTTLTAISDLFDEMLISKVLIVAPLRVANKTWSDEIKNWSHTKGVRYSICTGSAKNRVVALNKPSDVYIINRENIPWLVDFYGKKWPFDMVVIDESSSFKSPSSARFKALKKVSPLITRMVQLTGTPTPNGLMDVWSQIYLLDGGERLGRSMTHYKQCYFTADYMGYKFTPVHDAQERIERKISDLVLSMTADDYLTLPGRIDLHHRIELSEKHLKQYLSFEKEFITAISDTEIAVFNAAALANKLLQFANGCVYSEDKTPIAIHDKKLDALEDIIESANGEPVLVAYNFKTDLERITQRFPSATVLDKEGRVIDDWNNGKVKLLLAHPASAGHGLNLQKGGNIVVWFGLNWSLELYQQFNGRLHRQGQTKPVTIFHIVAEGTIDEKILLALASKAKTQAELIDALKKDITA